MQVLVDERSYKLVGLYIRRNYCILEQLNQTDHMLVSLLYVIINWPILIAQQLVDFNICWDDMTMWYESYTIVLYQNWLDNKSFRESETTKSGYNLMIRYIETHMCWWSKDEEHFFIRKIKFRTSDRTNLTACSCFSDMSLKYQSSYVRLAK